MRHLIGTLGVVLMLATTGAAAFAQDGPPKNTGPTCRADTYLLRGSVVTVGEGMFVMLVQRTNDQAHVLSGKQATIFMNGDTRFMRVGGGPLTANDLVEAQVKACRAKDGAAPKLLAKRVTARPPKPAGSTEPSTSTTTSSEPTHSATTQTSTEPHK